MGLFNLNKTTTTPKLTAGGGKKENSSISISPHKKSAKYNPSIAETIKRHRLQILTSSYIYEVLNEDSYLTDSQWDFIAKKLYRLQQSHPKESKEAPYYELFKDWTGDTASSLTYDEHIINSAKLLLFYKNGGK